MDIVEESDDKKTVVEMKMATRKDNFSPAAGGMRNTRTVSTALAKMGKMTFVL